MKDDWSLKGKKINITISGKDYVTMYGNFYKIEDIETLRQKLIEDLKEAIDKAGREIGDTIWVDEHTTLWDEIEHIIEKRFGKEGKE